jgi:hypothetical protein
MDPDDHGAAWQPAGWRSVLLLGAKAQGFVENVKSWLARVFGEVDGGLSIAFHAPYAGAVPRCQVRALRTKLVDRYY